jgi:hypothetical protein
MGLKKRCKSKLRAADEKINQSGLGVGAMHRIQLKFKLIHSLSLSLSNAHSTRQKMHLIYLKFGQTYKTI